MKNRWKLVWALLLSTGVANAAYVTIGNAGNADDTTGYGGVSYSYKISATEVTHTEFTASGAKIGAGNSEGYWDDGTRTVGTDAPAVNVSLYEARRYCNYLTTGNVDSGYYGAGGNDMSALSHLAYATANGSTFFVPTEDEWYKAAYYTGSGYSDYANGDDVGTDPTHGTTSGWNYNNGGTVNADPNYTWESGFGGEEQNGTYDMMGNVWEWTEDSAGVIRGGSYGLNEAILRSSFRSADGAPSNEYYYVGFRPVEVVPEPATALLLALGGGLAWLVRLKQRL